MRRLIFSLGLLLLFPMYLTAQYDGDCTVYNKAWTSPLYTPSDTTEHIQITGFVSDHAGSGTITGACTYAGANKSGYCATTCGSSAYLDLSETGGLTGGPLYVHVLNKANPGGGAYSNGGAALCGSQLAMGVRSCLGISGCTLTVSISAGSNGLGGSVSYTPASTIYAWGPQSFSANCVAQISPGCVMNPDKEPTGGGDDGVWEWHPYPSCGWIWRRIGNTPIIIDTDGSGFHLTSAAQGIHWDFFGNGKPIQIAWTASGSTNGWLAIDLNGNGTIDSAKELFSNVATQPTSDDPNGFLALAEYDDNHDGVIDSRDLVWPRLLVWIDANHDGISQPKELHHLDDIGIHSISLRYTESPKTDAYGNQFKLKGHLNPDKSDDVDRVIYDVTLTTAK